MLSCVHTALAMRAMPPPTTCMSWQLACTLSLQAIQRADSLGLLSGSEVAGPAGAAPAAAKRAMRSGRDSAEPQGPATPAASSFFRQRPRKRSWADLAGQAGGCWDAKRAGLGRGRVASPSCCAESCYIYHGLVAWWPSCYFAHFSHPFSPGCSDSLP